ncbi:unnamed protein product [Rhodiola kirilowii]
MFSAKLFVHHSGPCSGWLGALQWHIIADCTHCYGRPLIICVDDPISWIGRMDTCINESTGLAGPHWNQAAYTLVNWS